MDVGCGRGKGMLNGKLKEVGEILNVVGVKG